MRKSRRSQWIVFSVGSTVFEKTVDSSALIKKGNDRVFKIAVRNDEASLIVHKAGHKIEATPEFIAISWNKVSRHPVWSFELLANFIA